MCMDGGDALSDFVTTFYTFCDKTYYNVHGMNIMGILSFGKFENVYSM